MAKVQADGECKKGTDFGGEWCLRCCREGESVSKARAGSKREREVLVESSRVLTFCGLFSALA